MGLFGNLFAGKTPEYPPLDDQSRTGQKVAEVEQELQELMHKVSQPLEVVPTDHAAYVFIGKPPKKFGLAWIHDGKVSGLNTLIEEHGVTPAEIEKVLDSLREAYARHQGAEHYTATIDQRKVVVTASESLEHEVHDIIDAILH
ncbi:MAG: hypothetical protein KJN79_04380 [Gammaproteobacteria bacterium]|nr:hypothetical protein [Gammaproteobacteria bacterium]